MWRDVLAQVRKNPTVMQEIETGLRRVVTTWRKDKKRDSRQQWTKSGTAFALGAVLAAAGAYLLGRLNKQLQDGGGEQLRRQVGQRLEQTRDLVGETTQGLGERLEQTRSVVGKAAQDLTERVGQTAPEVMDRVGQTISQTAHTVGTQLEQARERLSTGVEETVPDIEGQISDLTQQASSVAQEAAQQARSRAEETVAQAGDVLEQANEVAEEASTRLGASESLGHEARRQEVGAEQAVDVADLIAGVVPAVDADRASVTPRLAVSYGMKVVDFDGTDIGRVKDVQEDGFVLSRPRGADLLVPLDGVYKVEGTLVYLQIKAAQVHRQRWERLSDEETDE